MNDLTNAPAFFIITPYREERGERMRIESAFENMKVRSAVPLPDMGRAQFCHVAKSGLCSHNLFFWCKKQDTKVIERIIFRNHLAADGRWFFFITRAELYIGGCACHELM